ncbi:MULTISPECIES: Cof-type HAD-IIB family hydrolase [unclassified Streptomyces]|uniref:Cof-type HAD-IIB family hydrolase n=1 Tax=unclassified Streptomyces TaxID=2593676 RepID=UPI000DAD7C20|nr:MULTISPECIES: Cof-type HAD-IIB family hydrolase [unclassified Streptomyces]PZT75387.1 hydrolase [Streptomyces sp. AC1-42T]PZT83840.1 hydrolase [Streptomyces sp. AC1-42W]
MIASDLDGTLLRRDGSLSPRTLRALRTAEEAGTEIVIVTARPPRFVDRLADATGLTGTAVCSNGALVYDLAGRTVVSSSALPLAVARQVAAALAAAVPGIGFALETGNHVLYEPAYRLRLSEDAGAELPVASLADLWLTEAPVTKLLAWSDRLDADTLMAAAREGAGDMVQLTHSGGRGLLEISAPGVHKAGALAALCEARGIGAADVIAFGDMPNDLTVLAWAGTGYAMANAHPAVLAAIPARARTNEEDGVAQVIEHLFAERGRGAR